MKFSSGTDSVAGNSEGFKLYTGAASVNVVAVNPTAEELSNIYGRTVEKVADYVGTDKNGKSYSRIDVIVQVAKVDNKKVDEKIFGKISFFLREDIRKNNDESKVQVINEYGKTAWATTSVLEAKGKPQRNDGSDMEDYILPYRPAFIGEEELINFLIAFLGIPSTKDFKTNTIKTGDALKECMASIPLEDIKQLLKGNIKSLKEVFNIKPNNEVYVMFAVQSNDENKKYQHVLSSVFAKAKDSGYKTRFIEWINKNPNRLGNLIYSVDFKEYKETPSEIPATKSSDNPWE